MNRWLQLVAAVAGMLLTAGVVCLWPLLRAPPPGDVGRSLAAAENAFATFIVFETLFVPLQGWLGDHVKAVVLVGAGGALIVVGALAGAAAEGVRGQTTWPAIGGAGAGLVYGGTVARALKRFTDRKMRCLGVTAAACAAVVGLAVLAFVTAVHAPGAIGLLVVIGGGQAFVVLMATLLILEPPPSTYLPPGS
jgi:OFA family oxalate/formate antiporter-like MFS transporter